jgi:hypothetical protein
VELTAGRRWERQKREEEESGRGRRERKKRKNKTEREGETDRQTQRENARKSLCVLHNGLEVVLVLLLLAPLLCAKERKTDREGGRAAERERERNRERVVRRNARMMWHREGTGTPQTKEET